MKIEESSLSLSFSSQVITRGGRVGESEGEREKDVAAKEEMEMKRKLMCRRTRMAGVSSAPDRRLRLFKKIRINHSMK